MPDSEYYKNRLSFDSGRDKVWIEVARFLQKYVPKDAVVLDIGAGYCSFINNIKAKEKHALDLYKGFVKYASKEVKPVVGNCTDLSNFKNNSFDVVFSSNLFEHLTQEEAKKTLREVFRVLKSDGRIIVVQPNFRYSYKDYFDDYTHKTIYTDNGLSDLIKRHGFKIIKRENRFLPFSLKSRLPKFGFLIRMYLMSPFKPLAKQMLLIGEKKNVEG
ncbi:class I SAM-dependent methyltransferase [Candidatus Woesearchaeota archaeon]|nr:class I SAM-dependent methyltransferase [Candidatus Woesearchaeota archaeon]